MPSILSKNVQKTLHKEFFTISEQKRTENVAQRILYYQWQNKFFLAWIDLSRAFDFRICFGKTVVAFDIDEKLTQSVSQVTIYYHVSEDFLCLHFTVDQIQDMIWKMEECHVSKNSELKI